MRTAATLLLVALTACKSAAADHGTVRAPMGEIAASADGRAALELARPDDEGTASDIQTGRLTAGTFDDALNPSALAAFAQHMQDGSSESELARLAAQFVQPLTQVTVIDAHGHPVAGARVQGIPTGSDGRVTLAYHELGSVRDGALLLVEHAGHTQEVVVLPSTSDTRVKIAGHAEPRRHLDVALVIDATGSMGDEMDYLKAELRSIVASVRTAHPDVDQRWALVVYRDQSDEYLTRVFDFTTDLAQLEADLGDQRAEGGGDYPEAMDRALQDGARLSWRSDAVGVAFLIADAPPHAQAIDATLGAIGELRSQGVAVVPVAASGVAEEAELVMRGAALLTGGQYLFLTDDSGVGSAHAEPHLPCYTVEPLQVAMRRVIQSELNGARIEPDPRHVVRTVGRARDGVCESELTAVAQ